jgi:Domain of unknown function (DUF4234)
MSEPPPDPPQPPGWTAGTPPGYGWPPPQPPPGYGWPPPQPPPGYGWPGPAYGGGYWIPGRLRSTGTSIALFFCTLGIYSFVYNYQVHTEMKRYSGRGIGGGIALLLTFMANVAMPFVTPAEVGSLYSLRGEQPPVRGWTGLWYLLPIYGSYFFGFFVIIIASVTATSTVTSTGQTTTNGAAVAAIVIAIVVCIGAAIAGGVIWFVKTNSALNRYWESLGVR